MKVSRIMALCLLVLLGGTTIVAVCLHAQAPAPRIEPGASPPGPQFAPERTGGNQQNQWSRVQYHNYSATDPKTLQLLSDEQAADQEAQTLAGQYAGAATEEQRADAKKKLKEKLAAIFEMQQKRRTAEIASIEERLAKLKDVSKKRETNKDAIVDRRLEQLTGGVDDLGWEDINHGARYSTGVWGNNALEPYRANVLTVPPGPRAPVPVPAEPRTRSTPLEKK